MDFTINEMQEMQRNLQEMGKGLYEKYGFEKIGDFKTVYGTEDQLFQKNLA